MTFNEYQDAASKTAIYPEHIAMDYVVLGLCNEVGELAGKLKKHYRDGTPPKDLDGEILKEAGDVLWYLSQVITEFGGSFDEVARANLAKLADRAARGVIKGSGDDR